MTVRGTTVTALQKTTAARMSMIVITVRVVVVVVVVVVQRRCVARECTHSTYTQGLERVDTRLLRGGELVHVVCGGGLRFLRCIRTDEGRKRREEEGREEERKKGRKSRKREVNTTNN